MNNSVLRCLTNASAMLAMSCASPGASAQEISSEALAAQADAIAIVEVAFVPYGNLVLLTEMLLGSRSELPDLSELLGPCLPGKAGVRELAESTKDPANSAVLDSTLEQAGYVAVIFLKRGGKTLSVLCDEPSFLENWVTHPHHPAWRSRLNATLGR